LRNTAIFNFEHLFEIFGEQPLNNFKTDFKSVGVSTDTRTIASGNIFVALKGEKYDAHNNLQEAIAKGASALIINHSFYQSSERRFDIPLIIVNDTLDALGSLANYHRNRFKIDIICVGGSNGKTTTKEMIADILSKKYTTLRTYGNYNNRIGVPLMLFQLNESHQVAVLEIGTNEPGEISILSKMIEPNFGLVTNIGREHLEKLEDIDGVEMEETYLFGYLRKQAGTAFINMDDERLRRYYQVVEKRVVFGNEDGLHVSFKTIFDSELRGILYVTADEKRFSVKLNSQGKAIAKNATAAIAVGLKFGIETEDIKAAIQNFKPSEDADYARGAIKRIDNMILINDSYNANPESMLLSLETLAEYPSTAIKVAVLGDMREMGDHTLQAHLEILQAAAKYADKVFLYGTEFKNALENFQPKNENIIHFEEQASIANTLKELGESVVLLKGSRGLKMEEVINKLLLQS